MNRATNRNYHSYIVKEWKDDYFAFDELQNACKSLKAGSTNTVHDQIAAFDEKFHDEILRVCSFIEKKVALFLYDLEAMEVGWNNLTLEEQKLASKDKQGRTMERMIRELYVDIKGLQEFYNFNRYLISKTVKKFEHVLTKLGVVGRSRASTGRMPSCSATSGRKLSQSLGVNESSQQLLQAAYPISPPDEDTSPLLAQHVEVVPDHGMRRSIIEDWMDTPMCDRHSSSVAFQNEFISMEGLIEKRLTTRCLKLYTTMFRHDYPNLAQGELDFIKSRDRGDKTARVYLGMKVGFTFAVVCQLILDSVLLDTYNFEFPIWTTYGISVYATIMNFLLFKTTWALSVGTWSKYSVNYISLFEMSNLQPNTIKILNETFTYWVLWSLSLALFFQANSLDSYLYNHTLNYMCPISLIGMSVCYLVVKSYSPAGDRGLFTADVMKRCLTAPYWKVRFRDTFAGDVLTSFTRVIQDSIYSGVWIVTGAFMNVRDGADEIGGISTVSIEIVVNSAVLFVLWIRLAQCCRNWYDTKHTFPHGFNAFKYLSAMIVVMYGLFRPIDGIYIFLICWATIYKWWWDVTNDWGLDMIILPGCLQGRQNTNKYTSLRSVLLYKYPYRYYIAIVINLILRFIWVVSLLPPSTLNSLFGPVSSVYFGSLEILRRYMWGLLRVEYEHLRFAERDELGYRIHRKHTLDAENWVDKKQVSLPDDGSYHSAGSVTYRANTLAEDDDDAAASLLVPIL